MNYFEKKQWIRLGICVVVLLAISLVLTGVIGGQHLTYKLEDNTETTKAALPAGEFAYTSEQETAFSKIWVYANAADGKITECSITSEAKEGSQDFLTDEMKENWAKSIVETGTAENDVITGATIKASSDAVIKGVNDIKEQAGISAPADETKDEKEAEETPTGLYGSFMAKRETNFSIIRVYIDTKNGEITKCRITSEAKSEGSDFLTDEIKADWAKAIEENGTAETDVITGATLKFSSAAVVEAVNEILANAK